MHDYTPPGRSRLLFALLYLGEGGPIGFIWWALPTWLRLRGLDVGRITILTSILVLPWVGKFLWAPLIDRTHRGGLRAWIVSAQLLMGFTLLPLIWLHPEHNFGIVAALLLAHAFSAATQDVAVDALALRLVPDNDRGLLNGAMQAGMLIGRSVFGGGALVLSAHVGFPVIIIALVACVWTSMTAVAFLREPEVPDSPRAGGGFWPDGAARIFRRPSTWLGLLFALTAGAAFESAGILAGPMLVDHGIGKETIGWLLGLPVVAATIIGGLFGGVLADRFGHARTVITGIVGFTVMVLVLAGLNSAGTPTVAAFASALTGLYLCIGLFIASSYALFMDMSRPPLVATQFTAFMAATNGCEAWSSAIGGQIASARGYSITFVIMAAVSLLSVPLVCACEQSRLRQRALEIANRE
jgi:MFS transporter, PAT family, beta-lactamase induction signal transducer AmpG